MSTEWSDSSLLGYGAEIYKRDHFTCVYCGFDGRPFDAWMQLSIDHVIPRSMGGKDDLSNLVAACRACNSITSRMKFSPGLSVKEILEQKKKHVGDRRAKFYDQWLAIVAPEYLKRAVPSFR